MQSLASTWTSSWAFARVIEKQMAAPKRFKYYDNTSMLQEKIMLMIDDLDKSNPINYR